MRLGLITDIHEDVEHLPMLLDHFQAAHVEQVVCIGDVFETGVRIDETCRLLSEARAIGVWGNHDFGLCFEPDPIVAERYSPRALEYLATFRSRLTIGDCEFSHVEPWLDPTSLEGLWYFDGIPKSPEHFQRIFAAARKRWTFAGHYHCWLAATPAGRIDWQGEHPLLLDGGTPYFCTIDAACHGSAALFDTATAELTPIHVT
ncbi:MAG: hypothetical protein EXS05_11590 [Planctomycetaceae bacterium]|nr:hypothetical protein [Planctomycetaceae bacterium]